MPRLRGNGHGANRGVKTAVVPVVGVLLLGVVVLMAARVGDTARFVTWPVVGFTGLAGAVALVGMWVGLDKPWRLAVGVVPALAVVYVLPAAPLAFVAGVVAALAIAAVGFRGVAAGVAMTVGLAMVLLVALQGPVVECGRSGVSSNSGPWWVGSQSSYSSSSSLSPDGRASGTVQVGDRHYAYACDAGRLTRFERTARPAAQF